MRVSVTELDAWRYWRDSEDAELDALLAQLRKQTPPSWPMLAGSAWHKALEQWPDAGLSQGTDVVLMDGFTFRITGDLELSLPAVRELKGEVTIQTSVGPVTFVGVVDGLDAAGIHDFKLTSRFDAERYADAYQWRCYLLMFGAQQFVYDIFVGRDDERAGEWLITDYHRMPFFAYPRLQEDVEREVERFAQFIATYLPEREQAAQQPALAG